ncbi:MAG: ABC transporter ATP-binding protein [Lachnospiraceae bacterium]|nr:ABC transporter ATP-binding protein [Lachnospiraceae bacterium]
MIIAENLCKEFEKSYKEGKKTKKEKFLAVDHVSLTAKEGEIVGILGPNGAGKTTLLRMLGALMTPTEGQVMLADADGREITDNTKKKEAIGYLSGNTKLYPRFSIREYLTFLGEVYEYPKQEITERIEKIIDVLDMSAFADNRIEKLSTGQTQRASIARCLMADPMLYILDEPTLGLDILSADAIIRFMKEQKEKGKTVLYSTHYLEEAQVLCDRIYMICGGKIVAQGSPAQLMEQTNSSNLREAFHEIYKESIGEDNNEKA